MKLFGERVVVIQDRRITSYNVCYTKLLRNIVKTAKQAYDLGIPAIILFGIPDKKDPLGTQAYAKDGIVQKAVREVKNKVPGLVVITDVCLCEYTDHGHCGIVEKGVVDNDSTLDLLARTVITSYSIHYTKLYEVIRSTPMPKAKPEYFSGS